MAVASPPPIQSAAAPTGPGYLSGLPPLEIEAARLGWVTKKFPDELRRLQYLESIGDRLARPDSSCSATRRSSPINRLCGRHGRARKLRRIRSWRRQHERSGVRMSQDRRLSGVGGYYPKRDRDCFGCCSRARSAIHSTIIRLNMITASGRYILGAGRFSSQWR